METTVFYVAIAYDDGIFNPTVVEKFDNKADVVIRFQICIFDTLNTAVSFYTPHILSCDSLSNLYL